MKISLQLKKSPRNVRWKLVKDYAKKNTMPLVLAGAVVTAFFIILAVFAIYIHTFNGGLTANHERWGTFGDFVGGILNPILAFLSFIALLFTVALQSRDLKVSNETLKETKLELEQSRMIAERQAKFYESEAGKIGILRAIESVHLEIKELFLKRVDFCPQGNNMGWYFSNSAPSAGAQLIPRNGDQISQNDRILLADISEFMMEISGYLHEYISRYGSSFVCFYYQRRLLTAKTRLVERGFLIDLALQGFSSPGYGWSAPAPVDQSLTNQCSRPHSASVD